MLRSVSREAKCLLLYAIDVTRADRSIGRVIGERLVLGTTDATLKSEARLGNADIIQSFDSVCANRIVSEVGSLALVGVWTRAPEDPAIRVREVAEGRTLRVRKRIGRIAGDVADWCRQLRHLR